MKLKEQFYKPRDLSENNELENIVDAVLKQKSMAMDTGYVADVCMNIIMYNILSQSYLRFKMNKKNFYYIISKNR